MTQPFRIIKIVLAITLLLLLGMDCSLLMAEVKTATLFGSNMVLQRDQINKIWGWAEPNEKIKLFFDQKTYKVKASKEGKWSINLDPHPAGGSFSLKIIGSSEVLLENITFGEVWLCGGQSNMQYTLRMLNKDIEKIPNVNNDQIRLFQGELGLDYQPQEDLAGGKWKLATAKTVPDFSATAYFYGKILFDSLNVPIGLISLNLGATSVETWMSPNSLKQFPQFKQALKESSELNKDFKQLNEELVQYRESWDKEYYLKGPGMEEKWFLPETPTQDWKTTTIPNFWEYDGLDHDGAVWFRKEFDLPEGFDSDALDIHLNQIDDYDIAWVNGEKVGETFGNRNFRNYWVPKNILRKKGNILVVRVFDIGGLGGFHTAAFWGNPILLGEWKYKAGLKIDAENFPTPTVPNGSIFSFPGLLYNGNIAPATSYAIRGAIWYQGESNEIRGTEYAELLPSLIEGWRDSWGYDFPFIIVQLANYRPEAAQPGPSNWAEIREAQEKSCSLPNVFLIPAIDLGEAADIHPRNKEEVGKRLGLSALENVYNRGIKSGSPRFGKVIFEDGVAEISFLNTGTGLFTNDKFGYIRGFQIAGKDKRFYWAKAKLNGNIVEVHSSEVKEPVSVRYAWSDNPGELNLYNAEGLPALPFRTDDWPLPSSENVYNHTPHQF